MTKLQQAIITISCFSRGLLIPVLNLILLDKGANLQTLPLIMAIYAAVVLLFELPSGICADLYGRKAVFLISCCMNLVCFILLMIADNFIWLVVCIIFFGLGRAFSSGSLDALFIDQAIETHGEQCLAKVTSRMAVLEALGLALGGFAGGIISDLSGTRLANILLRSIFTITVFILCFVWVKEQPVPDKQCHSSLLAHIRKGKKLMLSAPGFTFLFLGIFLLGFLLFSIETYWQPAYLEIPYAQSSTWVLGLITFLGFFGVTLGNIISQKILEKFQSHWWNVYIILRAAFTLIIFLFSLQKSIIGFVAMYTGTYFLLGSNNISESTLINKMTPNDMRASVLSLSSLILQAGSLFASFFSSLFILQLKFSGLWMLAGSLMGISVIITLILAAKRNRYLSDHGTNPEISGKMPQV